MESAPFLRKRKEIDPDQEGANKGDYMEEEGEGRCCRICRSKGHTSYCCSWTLCIPPGIDFVPNPGPYWMVVCKKCGNNQNLNGKVKECPGCGSKARYVAQKRCVACLGRGHLDNEHRFCKYYGMNDPFRFLVKRIIKGLGSDPTT